jgi:hypothetical protein
MTSIWDRDEVSITKQYIGRKIGITKENGFPFDFAEGG